tara:strand:+ start:119 stop:778 length:660 start_codon:yes stop_codon:yes gene_type:complete
MKITTKGKFNSIYLWYYPLNHNFELNTTEEKNWSKMLGDKRSNEYLKARSGLRKSLSNIFNIEPLKLEIYSKPGVAPYLINKSLGNINISHCHDAILIGWSKNIIGIDIERKHRDVDVNKLFNKIFLPSEKNNFDKNFSKERFMLGWTCKESAVKWEKKSLFPHIKNWLWDYSTSKINNIKSDIELKLVNYFYEDWIITAAFRDKDFQDNRNLKVHTNF